MTGRTLSHYRVLDRLGEGSSAVVHLAEDLVLGRPVVLKIFPPGGPDGEGQRLRFLHEARTASSLNHPNICTIHEIAEAEGRHFIVMELLDGQPVSALVAGGPLDLALLLDLAIQIADGLDAAHALGIVHRDIKPANIFVTRRKQAKILDFGIAVPAGPAAHARECASDAGASLAPSWGGTLPYMSPEQVRGEDLDVRSDLFSLGCVLYEMATGRRAFAGHDAVSVAAAIVAEPPAPVCDVNPALPLDLESIIRKTLEKNRQLRCQTAADLRADLQRLKRDLESAGPVAGELPPASGPGGRWLQVAAAAAAIAALAVAGLALADAQPFGTSVEPTPRPVPAGVRLIPPPAAATAAAPLPADTEPAPEPQPASPGNAGQTARATRARAAQTSSARKERPTAPSSPAAPSPAPTDTFAPDTASIDQDIRIARAQADHGLYDQALGTLRDALLRQGNGPEAVEAYFMMASIQEAQDRADDAMATYLQIANRFQSHPRAPEALFRLAKATLQSRRPGKDADAREILTSIVERYAREPWAVRALIARAGLEEQLKLTAWDESLGTTVPAALVSYRRAAELGAQPGRDDALWKLARVYEEIKRFDLAARTYWRLGEEFPGTRYDAWSAAAHIYDRRLKEPELARAAYARVPPTSPNYKDAQRQAARP